MDTLASFAERLGDSVANTAGWGALLAKLDSTETDIQDLTAEVGREPGLASRVLRLANSASIGMPGRIASLHRALVLLGQKRVRTLVLSTMVLNSLKGKGEIPLDMTTFCRHGAVTGLIAESIARHLRRYCRIDVEEAFAAGIVHDMGKLALAAICPGVFLAAREKGGARNVPYHQAEDDRMNHLRAGAILGEAWHFPAPLVASLSAHHEPCPAGPFATLVQVVSLADCMAHRLGYSSYGGEYPPGIDEQVLGSLPLPLERLKVIAEAVVAHQEQVEALESAFI